MPPHRRRRRPYTKPPPPAAHFAARVASPPGAHRAPYRTNGASEEHPEGDGTKGDPGRKGQPWQWPAGRPFWSDPVRRRPPVALGAPSRAATLSSTVRPSRQAWGDPVLRRPAVQLGVTLPSAGRKSYTTAAFFSPVSVLLTRSPPLREGGKKTTPNRAAAGQTGCG